MNKSLKFLYVLAFIFSFFGAFVLFFIPNSGLFYKVAPLITIILFVILLACKPLILFNFFKKLFCLKSVKILLAFFVFILGFVFFHYSLGHYHAPLFYYLVRIPRFFIYVITASFLPVTGLLLGFKFKDIIKIFYISIMIIFVIGFIQYLSFILNLNFMDYIFDLLTPERILYKNPAECRELLRVYSVFSEPSAFGQYIFIIMPFVIYLCLSKYKIFRNPIINKVFKQSLIPLMLANIIFTKSPIYLILCFSEFFILVTIYNWKTIRKYLNVIIIFIISSILIFILLIKTTSMFEMLKDTYIRRIFSSIDSFGDFHKLVLYEPSLATRIVYYYNQFIAFKQNLLFGCGLHNADIYLNKILLNSPIPLTPEIYERYYTTKYNVNIAYSLVWTGLLEFGLIGFSIYIMFILKNIISLHKITKVYDGIEQNFCQSLIFSIISIFFISFYNLNIHNLVIWTIYGLSILAVFNLTRYKRNNNG